MKKRSVFILAFVLVLQCFIFGKLQFHTAPGGDEVFSYTLANTPYSYDYIDHTWKHLPQSNGWIDASILKESYEVTQADRFNYGIVYWHERLDNHPVLYYSLVHTVSSFFAGQWRPYCEELINIGAFIGIDLILLLMFQYLTGTAAAAAVPILMMTLMSTVARLACLQRMYSLLALWGIWYLWINIRFVSKRKCTKWQFLEMIVVVFLGSLTHYYFYVYAFCVSLLALFWMIREKKIQRLLNYVFSGIMAVSLSLIAFPWMIWHIFFNQMNLHENIAGWNVKKAAIYFGFMNKILFNDRGYVFLILLVFFLLYYFLTTKSNKIEQGGTIRQEKAKLTFSTFSENRYGMLMALGSAVSYSLIIYTLDGTSWYYMTGIYLPWIVFASDILIRGLEILIKRQPGSSQKKVSSDSAIIIAMGIVVVVLGVSSIRNYIAEKVGQYSDWKSFHEAAISASDHDCIYVQASQDNLLSGIWFELGEYDEIKKLTPQEYADGKLSDQSLAGRKTVTDGLVVFTPANCNAPVLQNGSTGKEIAKYNGMICWEIK